MLDYYKRLDAKIATPAAVRGRRDGGARRLGSRREADGRRHLRQRVAAARGVPRAAARSRPSRRGSHPTSSTGRAPSPGARAATTAGSSSTSRDASRRAIVSPGRLRARAGRAEGEARGARRRPGPADRDGRAPAGGAVRGGATGSRPTSSSTSATSTGGASARSGPGRCTCSRTTRVPTTRTTHTKGCTCSWRTASRPGRGRSARCATWRRRCSSSSASPCRRTWRGESMLGAAGSGRAEPSPLATIPSRTRPPFPS